MEIQSEEDVEKNKEGSVLNKKIAGRQSLDMPMFMNPTQERLAIKSKFLMRDLGITGAF